MSLTEPKDIIYRAYYRVWYNRARREAPSHIVKSYIDSILWHLEYYDLNKMGFLRRLRI